MALLAALAHLASRRTWQLQLSVGHVQHHLRQAVDGAEEDAVFVEELAGQYDLPYQRADLDLSRSKGNAECAARRERYRALGAMASACSARHVATAHHSDDQLETLLMRLLRGTSVKGLAGMTWRRRLHAGLPVRLIRPMLTVNRGAVHEFLHQIGQRWREDPTNQDLSRTRSRLRHEVVPVLYDLRPDAGHRAVHLADHLRQLSAWLDLQTQNTLIDAKHGDEGICLDRAAARKLPPLILGAVLRNSLLEVGANADKTGGRVLRPILRAIRDREGGQRGFPLHGSIRVLVDRDVVRIVSPS